MIRSNFFKIKYELFVSIIIIIYAMVYEWGIFEALPISLIFGIKIFCPLLLLLLIPIRKIHSKYASRFIFYFALFMLYGLIPSLFSKFFPETIIQWFKFLPLVMFFILITTYMEQKTQLSVMISKLIVLFGVFSVVQFFLLLLLQYTGITFNITPLGRGMYAGPLGLLGNITSRMFFPGLPQPVFRLCGFWLEPDKASGFLFAAFFISRSIYILEKKKYWLKASYLCLVGGFMALSNAGYLSIAVAFLFGTMIHILHAKRILRSLLLLLIALSLLVVVFLGREQVARKYYNVNVLRILTGVRGTSNATIKNPYGGRFKVMKKNFLIFLNNPFGVGFVIPGGGALKHHPSGTALVRWLTQTGFLGLFLLLLREKQILTPIFKYSFHSKYYMNISQAWIVMFTQNMVYGSLMSPVYLILCGLLVSGRINNVVVKVNN